MIIRSIYISVIFVVLCVLGVGCDSIGVNDPRNTTKLYYDIGQNDLPNLKNGRLAFESQIEFNTFFDNLIENQDPSELDEFEQKISGFTSLRTVTNTLLGEEIEENSPHDHSPPLRIVEDPVLESLLNQNAEIQIADSVYKVTHNYVYSTTSENEKAFSEVVFRSSFPSKEHIGIDVTILEIDRLLTNDIYSKSNDSSEIQGKGECWDNFPNQGRRKYRLKGSSWIINWGFVRTFGSEVESQQKRKGLFQRWYHKKVKKISMNGTFSKRINDPSGVTITLNETVNRTKYYAAEIRRTHARDRSNKTTDDITAANIQMSFSATKDNTYDTAFCSSTRSWNW